MEKLGLDALKTAGVKVINLIDTFQDALEDKKIDMGEWFEIGNAGVNTVYVFNNAGEIWAALEDLTKEQAAEVTLYWKENTNVGVDDEVIYEFVLDGLELIHTTYIDYKDMFERFKTLKNVVE